MKRKEKVNFDSPDRLNRLVEGTKVIGDLIADSSLRIDGEVIGNVSTSAKVVIGENGIVKGNLSCQEADIEGKLEGNIDVEGLLTLRRSSRITGDIRTAKIQIEEGAVFIGTCSMDGVKASKNEKNAIPKAESDLVY